MANRFLNNIRINDEYTFPENDGSAGQAIVTDGSGNLSFGSAVASSADSTESVHINVKNTSGSQILKGTPVYVTGETGNSGKIEIAPADASDSAKMPALGILESTLNNNAEGFCVQGGLLEGLATATIDGTSTTANDTVYVKAGGGLTMTKPTGSNLIQNIAKVARVHASNGSLVVSSILRTNDVPNLTTGKIWVGTANNTAESTVVHLDETNERMGIGTASPSAELDVNGVIRSRGGTYAADVDTKTDVGLIIPENDFIYTADGSNYLRKLIGKTSDIITIGEAGTSLIDGINLVPGTSGGYVQIFNDSSVAAKFVDGKLGIGTTSPSEKLTVNGAVVWQGALVSSQTNSGALDRSGNDLRIRAYGATAGTGNLVFRTGGGGGSVDSEAMRITSGGNVGIGTTSPVNGGNTAKWLTLNGQSGSPYSGGIVYTINDSAKAYHYVQDTFLIHQGQSGIGHRFFANGSEKMRITSGGNVGIGTTSPLFKLHSKVESSTTALMLENSAGGGGSYVDLDFNTYSTQISGFANAAASIRVIDNAAFGGDITFRGKTNGAGNTQNETMRIEASGNVGINETSPSQKLHVAGNLRVTGAYYDSNNSPGTSGQVLSSTATGTDWITLNDIYYTETESDARFVNVTGDTMTGNLIISNNNTELLRITGANSTYTAASILNTGTGAARLYFDGSNGDLSGSDYASIGQNNDLNLELFVGVNGGNIVFTENGGESMRVQNGNVGIGTTSPGDKLTVNGNISLENSGTPIFTLKDTGNAGGGGASGMIRFKNTAGDAIGIGYTSNDTTTSDLLISTNAASTYGGYLGLDANAITDPSSIILDPKTNVIINGNVGIGTDSPGQNLEVSGQGNTAIRLTSTDSTTSTLQFADSDDANVGLIQYDHSNNYMLFRTNDGERVRIDSTGNVGIGTTSPSQKLHVAGNLRVTGFYRDSNNSAGTPGQVLSATSGGTDWITLNDIYYTETESDSRFVNVTGDTMTGDLYLDDGAGASPSLYFKNGADNYWQYLTQSDGDFSIKEGTSTRLTFQAGGNVGIGATNPSSKLEVSSADTIKTAIHIDNTSTGGNRWDIASIGSGVAGRVGNLQIRNDSDSTNYVEITAVGNVGIGTTSPQSKLHVAGDVIFGQKRIVNLPSFSMGAAGVTDEYLVICKQAPAGSGVNASGIQGRIVFSRGSSGSYNNSHYIDINIQMSLDNGNVNNLDVNQFEIVTDQIVNHAFTQIEEIDINGTKYVALKARTSGGGAVNHFYFEGSISDDGADTNILSRVRASDANITVTSPQPSGYPITPYIVKNNNGQIGIGTTNPGYKLDVNGDGRINGVTFVASGATRSISTHSSAGQLQLNGGTDASNGAFINIAGDSYVTGDFIDYYASKHYFTGNVGIGTTSPSTKLHVQTSSSGATRYSSLNGIDIEGTGVTGINILSPNDGYGRIYFGSPSSNTAGSIEYVHSSTVGDGYLILRAGASSTMYIKGGNVGIGETNPQGPLHIVKTASESVIIQNSDNNGNSDDLVIKTNYDRDIGLKLETSGGQYHIALDSNGDDSLVFHISDINSPNFEFYQNGKLQLHSYGSGTFTGTATQRLGVDSSGNVIEIPIGSGAVDGSGSAGQVAFWTDNDTISGENSLYWDSTNDRLGIQVTPSQPLDVNGTALIRNTIYVGDDIQHWGDGGTGMFFGTDTISLKNDGGSTRLFVESGGNVGIGTTSPGDKLTVQDGTITSTDSSGTNYAKLDRFSGLTLKGNGAGTRGVQTPNTDALTFGTNNTERIRITSTGNVGIGTTSPSQKAVISGPNTTPSLNTTAVSSASLLVSNSDTGYGTYFASTGGGIGLIQQRRQTSAVYYDLALQPYGGNVGIGTTSPDSKLHLQSASATGAIINLESTHTGGIPIYNLKGAHSAQLRYQDENGNNQSRIDFTDSGSFNFIDATDGSSHMRITSSGNVGIGTDSPQTELHVKGNNGWSEIRIEGQTFASGHGGSLEFYSEGTALADIYASTDKHLYFRTNGTSERMRITSGGNVGIGTTNPSAPLNVFSSSVTDIAIFENNASSIALKVGDSSNTNYANYVLTTNSGNAQIFKAGSAYSGFGGAASLNIYNSNGAIAFHPNGNSNSVFINTSGKVGIGTTSPGSELEVDGEITTTTLTYDEPGAVDSSAYNGEIVYFGSQISMTEGKLMVLSTSAAGLTWYLAKDSTTSLATGMLGIALGTAASDGVLVRGIAKNSAWSSFSEGEKLYLSPTGGSISNSITSDTNDFVRIVGYALGGNKIYFCPDNTYIQNS